MSDSVKFNGDLNEVTEVLGDWPWRASAAKEFWLFDEKQGKYVSLEKGQFVVKIADRFEVADKEPQAPKTPRTRKDSDTESNEDSGDGAS